MELCGVNGKLYESETALKNILSKYDTLDGNRLSLQGFISYYRDIAASEPRQVLSLSSGVLLKAQANGSLLLR